MKLDKRLWKFDRVVDLRRIYGDGFRPRTCEECGKQGLRYVHIIARDDPQQTKRVGACCAKNLVSEYDAFGTQRRLQNQFARVCRIPTRKGWYESNNGNQTIVINGWRLTIYRDSKNHSRFRCMVVREDEKRFSPDSYRIEFEAKAAAGWMFAELAGWLEEDSLQDGHDGSA